MRYAGSGSAPLPPELLSWYRRLGLELLEGYGMTENFNYSHLSQPGRGKVGYVGEANEGCEARIAEDGEMQLKSPGNMMGYFKNEEATKETFTEDGWLRTGEHGVREAAAALVSAAGGCLCCAACANLAGQRWICCGRHRFDFGHTIGLSC